MRLNLSRFQWRHAPHRALACLAVGAASLLADAGNAQPPMRLVPRLYSQAAFDSTLPARLLVAHNAVRQAVGVAPLRWDPALAMSAAAYGPPLAALGGRLQHSPRAGRPGQAENLWMGSRGAYTPEQMVGYWIDERNQFRRGIFPAVSTTGNWVDVGHYTQMIWPATTTVGCAIHRAARFDYLICRYAPRGNADGKPVG